jgi:hypothetical protein
MMRYILFSVIFLFPFVSNAEEKNDTLTLTIRPIGVDYSKYSGTNKLFMVGECKGLSGNQVVVFQNRPSFDYFENDQTYKNEQKELESAIWSEILDKDDEPMILKGRWHKYQDRMVFLCHKIVQLNRANQKVQ